VESHHVRANVLLENDNVGILDALTLLAERGKASVGRSLGKRGSEREG
jgi:hypothetical protein